MTMQQMDVFLRKIEKLPISDLCPLIENMKWKCPGCDKGNEERCKSTNGYMNCPHFKKWFFWNVMRLVAKEIAKENYQQKKKEPKKKI